MTKFEASSKLEIDTEYGVPALAGGAFLAGLVRKIFNGLTNAASCRLKPGLHTGQWFARRTYFLGLALILAGCGTTKSISINSPPNQMAKHLRLKKQEKIEINYLLFLPKGYEANAQKRWPLILFLHGAGERGTNVWKVATHGPPKNVTSNPDFPFIVVSPQCPEGEIWSNDALLALLDEITLKHAVDTSRIYLTGLSMGGYGTWRLGLTHPEKFAAIVPICGGG